MSENNLAQILASLTREEKANLVNGESFWTTHGIPAKGVPSITVTDGPHGIRKQSTGGDHLGLFDGEPATCFPPAVALGSSWDIALAQQVGSALGREAKAMDVSVLLGPGINIKRDPRCGRNFEYFSEDPFHSGIMGSAWVRGVQSQGIGTSLKHFAANNQEYDRMRVSAEIDARTLREIYLRAFERVVRAEEPWTVMSSYNKINGTYASQDTWLLTDVLRNEWGFAGLVVSDWGAVHDPIAAVAAGLDLRMPATDGKSAASLVDALRTGTLTEAELDACVVRVLELALKGDSHRDATATYDPADHHELAVEAAARGVVLLKNDDRLLPIDSSKGTVAVVGAFARQARYQGAGSSKIVPTRLENTWDALNELAGGVQLTFAEGFTLTGESDDALWEEALATARGADTVLYFMGLPDSAESEGFDRSHIDLPANQLALLRELLAANSQVVVIISNGAVVRLDPWQAAVPAILEGWLLGQGGGRALAELVLGMRNPSGKLTETIPVRLEDTPAWTNFPGEFSEVKYGEGLFVGYRHYDVRQISPSYEFGYGLSYTTFNYTDAQVTVEGDELVTRLQVTNTGNRDGREIVQVYIGLPQSNVSRAVRELRGFASVEVGVGQTAAVEIRTPISELAYYCAPVSEWVVEGGEYRVEIGASSRDIRHSADVTIAGNEPLFPLTRDSTITDWNRHPTGGPLIRRLMQALSLNHPEMATANPGMLRMAEGIPLSVMVDFPGSPVSSDALDALLALTQVSTQPVGHNVSVEFDA